VVAAFRRAALVLLASLAWPTAPVFAQKVSVEPIGDALRIRAPGFSFLKGEPLVRLKDGRSVRVELVAMVLAGPGQPASVTVRRIFALSYDLWEERFAVTSVDARSQSVSHLAQAAAEAWCLEQLAVPIDAAVRQRPFWIRLEYRIVEPDAAEDSADLGYTLQALIDLLSRRRKTEPAPPALEAGPFTVKQGGPSARR
jgi:hypothetical protein